VRYRKNNRQVLCFRYSYIYQDTSTKRQRSDLFRFSSQAATCYYLSNHLKVEAITLSALSSTQQANLLAYLHTNSFNCWTSSREAVNTNF